MEAMTKLRSHSAAFKRQVAEEFLVGETLQGLSQRHHVSRQLIRIWAGKFEAGALDEDVQAADLIQEYVCQTARNIDPRSASSFDPRGSLSR
jgi:transposase